MKLSDFDYDLPEELIAQEPAPRRDSSRLMVISRRTGAIEMGVFTEFPGFLGSGDCLVVNDSRVFPARLIGRKDTGGRIEMLLLRRRDEESRWEVLLRPAKRVNVGTIVTFGDKARASLQERISQKRWLVQFQTEDGFDSFLDKHGHAPLPPYIKRRRDRPRRVDDLDRYQTVYARVKGSVAAPTAGLHFTEDVLAGVRSRKAQIASVTLHVGYGTFVPIETDEVEEHVMEEEYYWLSEESARKINDAERVVAVGTTVTRVLESVSDHRGYVAASSGQTRLFIYPGYQFKRVDALLTNFHLPKSTLFLLVCAFAGETLIRKAYETAIANRFRFYSYGDCMLIL